MIADQTKPNNAHVDKRLREEPMIWFTSVRANGRLHTVPVWFLWDGETFLIFNQTGNLKIRNLQRNPHVTLALNGTKQGMDVVIVEGEAEILSEPRNMVEEFSQQIRIKPTKFLSWVAKRSD